MMGSLFRGSTICLGFLLCAGSGTLAADWKATVTAGPAGPFAAPRSFRATYSFGWSGFTAATSDIRLTKLSGGRLQVEGTGRTVGLARALWKLDARQTARANARTLRPIDTRQTETIRSKKIATHLVFDSNGVTSSRTERANPVPKVRRFDFPSLFDLQSSVLYIRSQSLKEGNVQRIVVYPATSAYLATVTVLKREKISVRAGSYNAIKLDLQLNKIGKTGELESHRKFRRATAWISDDPDRLLLKISAQVFVGTVFAELQSVRFGTVKD